jgi:hypothetical protein
MLLQDDQQREKMNSEFEKLVEELAISEICPYTLKPATPYEINAVKKYTRFGLLCVDAAMKNLDFRETRKKTNLFKAVKDFIENDLGGR